MRGGGWVGGCSDEFAKSMKKAKKELTSMLRPLPGRCRCHLLVCLCSLLLLLLLLPLPLPRPPVCAAKKFHHLLQAPGVVARRVRAGRGEAQAEVQVGSRGWRAGAGGHLASASFRRKEKPRPSTIPRAQRDSQSPRAQASLRKQTQRSLLSPSRSERNWRTDRRRTARERPSGCVPRHKGRRA